MRRRVLPFTGWEPHNAIRAVRASSGLGSTLAIVHGREPITTTEFVVAGQIVEERWTKYDRGLTLRTERGAEFRLGGTNTTSSIACQYIVLYVPELASQSAPSYWQFSYPEPAEAAATEEGRARLAYAARLNRVAELFVSEMSSSQHAAVVEDLRRAIESCFAAGRPSADFWREMASGLIPLLASEDLHRATWAAEMLGLFSFPESALALSGVLQRDGSPLLKREAALSLRSMEVLLQSLSSERAGERETCVNALAAALADNDAEVRVYAAEDLGYFSNAAAVAGLGRVLEKDPEEHAQWAAAVALGRYADPSHSFPYLLQALAGGASDRVRRSCMLGIGRMLPKLRADRGGEVAFVAQISDLRKRLLANLKEYGRPSLSSYAAYCVGELGDSARDLIPALVEALQDGDAFEIVSNAVLALSKTAGLLLESESEQNAIGESIARLLRGNRPTAYPSSAYFEWFLEHAAELLVKFEARELAAQCYKRAADECRDSPWRAGYYTALSHYESAEHSFGIGDLPTAVHLIEAAIGVLSVLRAPDHSASMAEKFTLGVAFRVNMAEARRSLLRAVLRWGAPSLATEDYDAIEHDLREALKRYKRIVQIELDPGAEGRGLSRDELALFSALVLLPGVGIEAVELARLYGSRKANSEELLAQLGRLDAAVDTFVGQAGRTHSKSLRQVADYLKSIVMTAYDERQTVARPLTATVGKLVVAVQAAFLKPLPTPAVECRLIGPGRASLRVQLSGAMSGNGEEDTPFIFPSDLRIVFRVVVTVVQRSQNETLLLADNNPTGLTTYTDVIHIHEGTWAKTYDYGQLSPAGGPNLFEFILSFKNSGCAEEVDGARIWVRVVSSATLSDEMRVKVEKKAALKVVLESDVRALEEELAAGRSPAVRSRILTDKQRELGVVSSELDELWAKVQSTRPPREG